MKRSFCIFLTSMIMTLFMTPFASAYTKEDIEVEHVANSVNTKIDLVKITPNGNIVQKENYLVVNFAQNFNSKYYKPDDYVQFVFDNDFRTNEGTILIPCGSSLIARIVSIENPKWFSRNAKVFLEFTHIVMQDGSNIPVYVELAGKKNYLQEGAKETAGKIAAYTLTIGGVGSGLGAAIGVAAGHTITGLIIGGSVGGGVGLVSGIVSPGLHYRARKGEPIILELKDNLKLPN